MNKLRTLIDPVAVEALQQLDKTMVYISGPMTNVPENNAALFMAVGAELSALGFPTFNPVANQTASWVVGMEQDLAALTSCGAMLCLTDWQVSCGARIEVFVARALEIPIIDMDCGPISYELIDAMTRSPLEQLVVNQALRIFAIRRATDAGLWS